MASTDETNVLSAAGLQAHAPRILVVRLWRGVTDMAHSKQARKRILQNERRAAHNRPLRTRASRTVREARTAITRGEVDSLALLREAQSALDKAARHGVIHANAAARRKSRLAARLKAAGVAAV